MKRSKALLSAATLVLVPTLLLAGCGSNAKSSDKATSSSTPSSTPSVSPSASASADANGLVPIHADGFSISLPGQAQSSQQTFNTKVGPVTGTVYATGDNSGGFFVALVPYPANAKISLDGAVNGIAKGYSGTVKSNQTIAIQGHPARQALIEGTSQGQTFTFYVLAVDDAGKLFQAIYAIKGAAPATPPALLGQVSATLTFS